MKKFLLGMIVIATVLLHGLAAFADVVVTFDDLTSNPTIADGYAGITWNGQWGVEGAAGFNHTGTQAAFPKLANSSFTFGQPVIFEGLDYTGSSSFGKIQIELFYHGDPTAVWTSLLLSPNTAVQHLASGSNHLVDKVTIIASGIAPTYVIDNLTFQPVPEPATFVIWSLLGGVGIALNWRRQRRTR